MYERLETRHASNKTVSGQDNQQRQGHSYPVVQLLAKTSIRLCQQAIPIIKKFTMNSAHQKHFHLKQTLSNTCSHNKGYDAYQLSTEKVIPGLH